jgi:hypothetical protein
VIFCFEKNICRELRGHRLILDVTGVAETFGNYMSETSASTVEPAEDILLPIPALALRWHCGRGTALQRAKAQGLPITRWNARVVCVRLSDVIAAEGKATL